jgi:hypothetical protein
VASRQAAYKANASKGKDIGVLVIDRDFPWPNFETVSIDHLLVSTERSNAYSSFQLGLSLQMLLPIAEGYLI